jgi:hypothetical protein
MSSKYFIWIVHVSMCLWKFSGNFCDFLSIFRALKHFLGYLENVFALKIKFGKNPFFLVGPSPSSEVCPCPFISLAGRITSQAVARPRPAPAQTRARPRSPFGPRRSPPRTRRRRSPAPTRLGFRAKHSKLRAYKAAPPCWRWKSVNLAMSLPSVLAWVLYLIHWY